jgi:hypothetical protein
MSDSSIPSVHTRDTDTLELRQTEDKKLKDLFQEQSEWYPKTGQSH